MADVVATLGLAVDASGALVDLKQFETATKATGASATKAADDVVAASNRITSATRAEAAAIREKHDAAVASRASAQVEKAATVAGAEAFLEAERARKSLTTATKEGAAATAANTALEVIAMPTAKELSALWTGQATAAGKTAEAIEDVTAATAGSVASQAALGGVIGAVLIAVQVLGTAYDVFTEKTRKMKLEQDEARKSLEALQDRQRQGAAGQLVDDVEKQRNALRDLAKGVANLSTELARPSVIVSNNNTGATDTRAFTEARLAAKQEEYNKLQALVERGQREITRIESQQETERLAAARVAGALTVAEAKRVNDQVAQLRADLATNIAGGGDLGERTRMISEIKALTATTQAETEAKKGATAAERLFNQQLDRSIERFDAAAKNRAALNKAYADGKKAVDDAAAATRALGLAQELNALADARDRKALEEKEKRVRQVTAALQALQDLGPNANLSNIGNANVVIGVEDARDATEGWLTALSGVLGVTQLIAQAFGEVGQEIVQAASGAQSIIAGLSQANRLKDAGGNSIGIGKALSGAAGTGAFASGLGAAATIAAGAVQIADALGLFDDAARRAREGQIAYTKSLEEFAIVQRTGLEDQLRANIAEANRTAQGAFAASGATGTIAFKDGDDLQRIIEQIRQGPREFRKLADSLDELLVKVRENEDAIRERNAEESRALQQSQEARKLRALGLTEEAEALEQASRSEAALAEIRKKYGEQSAEYLNELWTQSLEAAARAIEAIKEKARKAEQERRNIFDNDNAVRAISDPRGAAQAAFDEDLQRRYADAVARGASDVELLSIAARNAAEALDRAAQIAEQDLRTTESLIARALGASGNTRAAQDSTFNAGQRQEMADAIRAGMSEGNLALLRFTQFAERSQLQMQRAIEDGTKAIQDRARDEIAAIDLLIEVTQNAAAAQIKAIDEQIEATQTAARATAKAFDQQISAIREQTKAQTDAIDAQIDSARDALNAAQQQLSVLEKSVQTNTQVVTAMRELRDSLKLGNLSPLSPEDKLAEARAQFERTAAAAAGGDSAAALRIPAAAQALLEASRAYNASGPGFVSDFNRVNEVLTAIEAQYGATLPVEEAQLEAARAAVDALQQTIESLGEQKQAITDAAQRQIDALQSAKDKAAEDAQKQLDKLNEQKDAINEGTRLTIERLQETRQAIETAAQRQIEQLVLSETRQHEYRLRDHGYWDTFLGFTPSTGTGDSRDRLRTGPRPSTTPAPLRVAEEQLSEARTMRQEIITLRTEIEQLRAEGKTGNDIAVGASRDEVTAIGQVVVELRQLIQETRNTNQANTARAASRR